jgi:hypothetical protein
MFSLHPPSKTVVSLTTPPKFLLSLSLQTQTRPQISDCNIPTGSNIWSQVPLLDTSLLCHQLLVDPVEQCSSGMPEAGSSDWGQFAVGSPSHATISEDRRLVLCAAVTTVSGRVAPLVPVQVSRHPITNPNPFIVSNSPRQY